MEKLVHNFRYYGNVSNASIATSLGEMLKLGRLQDGQWIALPAVGGGMNYGCWLLRWRDLANPQGVQGEE
jgi:3-oxoacyl-[acyl-carrier-protein] synthase-3